MNEQEIQHFTDILKNIRDLRLKKSKDYGCSWKIYGLDGILWQIRSKFIRMLNLVSKKESPANEPLRDTFMDMANYCIMAIQLIDMNETNDKIEELLEINK